MNEHAEEKLKLHKENEMYKIYLIFFLIIIFYYKD